MMPYVRLESVGRLSFNDRILNSSFAKFAARFDSCWSAGRITFEWKYSIGSLALTFYNTFDNTDIEETAQKETFRSNQRNEYYGSYSDIDLQFYHAHATS